MIEKKLLFVDDEESQRDVIKRVLDRKGYNTRVAKSATEALKILETEEFPLIITDLNMPGIDGIQLCKIIKQNNAKSIVIALSGYIASLYLTEHLEETGFDGWIAKPISTKRLDYVVKGAFDKIRRGITDKGNIPTNPANE
jgi:CheY-like chemotaxis protein